MKIGNIRVRISIVQMAVVVFFLILLSVSYYYSRDTALLIWGPPIIVGLFVIPIVLNYMSQSQYVDLAPMYEKAAKPVRVKMINRNMIGQNVKIEGVIERVYFQWLNRPQYLVADRSGEISVKMFTTPLEDVKKGEVVEVVGQVIHRYIFGGDAAVNAVSIKKIAKKPEKE